jgi:hypothetical protein
MFPFPVHVRRNNPGCCDYVRVEGALQVFAKTSRLSCEELLGGSPKRLRVGPKEREVFLW